VAAPPFGYHGCYLRIDVSTGSVARVPISDAVLRQFIGGSGLGAWLLIEESQSRPDALAPEAPLIFVFSPLVGSPLTTSAKFAVVSKSPLTDRINDSLASSGFAIAGKQCGCDAIVIVGRAAELSTLVIDDGLVRIDTARDLRGESCGATETAIKARLGTGFQVAAIGPAGERAVRYARFLTMDATPAEAEAARCSEARISRRSPSVALRGVSGRSRGNCPRTERRCRNVRSALPRRSTASSAPRRTC